MRWEIIMGYVTNNLMPDERVLHIGKIHWFVFVSGTLLLLTAIGLFWVDLEGGVVQGFGVDLEEGVVQVFGAIVFILAMISLIEAFIFKISTELAITSKRVIAKVGFISRNTVELNHRKVESFIVDQSIFGRIFGFGTIVVCGTGGGKTPIPNIDNPLEFRRQAMKVADEADSQQ
jgi:uncharacterized membrane protein YdbT with pleckstrin-like domain